MTESEKLREAVRAFAMNHHRSIRSIAVEARIPPRSLQSIMGGSIPSVDRAKQICEPIGFEFYIGPPRTHQTPVHATNIHKALKDIAVPPQEAREVVTELLCRAEEALELLRSGAESAVNRYERESTDVATGESPQSNEDFRFLAAPQTPGGEVAARRPVAVVEVFAAAGVGADVDDERVVGHLWFRRNWLDRHGLDPKRCTVIRARGESMEPTVWDGSSVLVDRSRTEWRPNRIFVLRTPDGPVIKRAGLDAAGDRVFLSDHPAWDPVPAPDDAEVIGQVVWTARTLEE